MGTQLILTVGTNALPVWMAWYHLKDKLPQPVDVLLVYTNRTKDAKELLECYYRKAGTSVSSIETSAHNPEMDLIHKKIIKDFPTHCTNLHVHYTGGTQAMGVATVTAMMMAQDTLRENNQHVSMDASYLDPGRESAPTIVSWKGSLIRDTRVTVKPDIHKIADLNNFQAGGFCSRNYKPYNCPRPGKPAKEKLVAGQTVLENIRCVEGQFRNYFSNPKSLWNKIFRPKSDFVHPSSIGTFSLPKNAHNIWREQILPVLNTAYTNCQWCPSSGTLSYDDGSAASADQKRDLEEMHGFFNGIWLEYAAYAAFVQALEKIKSDNSCRDNYGLFHNVYVRRKDATDWDPHFELDVVAVLGYQVVVVSCGVTSNRKEIKLKAMEAYHRAKQLGGDEARAVVVCVANHDTVQGVEKELEDETGTKRPLQVWGRSTSGQLPSMESLHNKFRKLLSAMHWQ